MQRNNVNIASSPIKRSSRSCRTTEFTLWNTRSVIVRVMLSMSSMSSNSLCKFPQPLVNRVVDQALIDQFPAARQHVRNFFR